MAEKPKPCSEPDGNVRVEVAEAAYQYAHDLMIQYAGQCPWCGKEN